MKQFKILYFNSTHWDREWYQPFQEFRFYLVRTMAGVLESLDRPDAAGSFCFDGQSVVVEDVLALAPELESEIRKHLHNGKLKIGPWYVQPDEFLVSGEALIHNLLLGRRIAQKYGATPWATGYVCDVFGHIAQLPQLLQGFDIAVAALWRGAPGDAPTYFVWESPDGSQVLTYKMKMRQGYGDFTGAVTDIWDKALPEAEFMSKAEAYINQARTEDNAPVIVLMDAVDHAPAHRSVPLYLQRLRTLYPAADVAVTDLADLAAHLAPYRKSFPVYRGEMNHTNPCFGGYLHLISHTLSSYYEQKRANDRLQNRLEVFGSLICALVPERENLRLLDLAWKYLLMNHAHDSICGCSIDVVHADVDYRFRQVDAILETLRAEWIIRSINAYTGVDICDRTSHISGVGEMLTEFTGQDTLVSRIYNPLPFDWEGLKTVSVRFPVDYQTRYAEPFGYENINSFILRDESGRELPYAVTGIQRNQLRRFHRYDCRYYDIYDLAFILPLRAMAWNSVKIEPSVLPSRYFESLLSSVNCAQNEDLRLTVHPDGTFMVLDKKRSFEYGPYNRFLIDGEIGDGWNHVAPKTGAVQFDDGRTLEVKLLIDSPVAAVFEITKEFAVPEKLEFAGTIHEKYRGVAAAGQLVPLRIVTRVTLAKASAQINVAMTVDNPGADLRLRLRVPSFAAAHSEIYQSFAFLERGHGRTTGTATQQWREPEQLEKNFSGICGRRDADKSQWVLAGAGLHEVAALADEFDFTLLRSFRRTVGGNGETVKGQGKFEYDYALCFADADVSTAEIFRQLRIFTVPLTFYTEKYNDAYDTACDASEITLTSKNIVLSIVKVPEDVSLKNAMVLRLVNLSKQTDLAQLTFQRPVAACYLCELNESVKTSVVHDDCQIMIKIDPCKILTLLIQWKGN